MRKPPRIGTISPEPWRSIAIKWGVDNPFQLLGKNSLFRVLGNLLEGKHVPFVEFQRVLRANADRPIPPILLRAIRGRLKSQGPNRRGRPAGNVAEELREYYAAILYQRYLAWTQSRQKKPYGLNGWPCIRGATWWQGSPHERALRMVRRRLFRHRNISVLHVRNLISSRR
jgi:hypothetical protein